jgi:hypothetical protein
MRKILVIGVLATLAAGCAQHAAPQSAVSSGTTAQAVTTSAAPAVAPMPADLAGASITLSANYPTQDQVFTNVVNGTVPAHWAKGALHSATGRLVQ